MSEYAMDWKYRFANFQWALAQLTNSLSENDTSDELSKEVPLYFDVASELAHKSLNDYLIESGYVFQSLHEMLEIAFRTNLIGDVARWKLILEKDMTTDDLIETGRKIRENHQILIALHEKLGEKIPKK